jgi:hypothetical protein
MHTIRGTTHHQTPRLKKPVNTGYFFMTQTRAESKYVLIASLLIHTQDNSKRTQHIPMRTKK